MESTRKDKEFKSLGADSDFHQNDMPVGTTFGGGLEVGDEESCRVRRDAPWWFAEASL